MESILLSIKKLLGITEEYKHFDPDIIMHINTVFDDLSQLGVVPYDDFRIEDETSVWTDYVPDAGMIESIKSYMYLRVKLLFDPPLNSSIIESMNRQIERLEWRINTSAESQLVKKDDIYKLEEVTATKNGTVITPSKGCYGINKVNVDVEIPTITKTVQPSTSPQVITSGSDEEYLSHVFVEPVTSDIDENIQPENILSGVEILGVSGTNRGYDLGYSDGHDTGYDEGHIDGTQEGHESGYAEGHKNGLEGGRHDEHVRFMNHYQQQGNRTDCAFMFAGAGWTPETFDPIYDLRPVNAANMFFSNPMRVDLTELLKSKKVTLDTSRAESMSCMFQKTKFTRVPVLDARACTSIGNLFFGSDIEIVDGLIIDENVAFDSGCFQYAGKLRRIKFIGRLCHSLYMQWCTSLETETAVNIIHSLQEFYDPMYVGTNTIKFPDAVWSKLNASSYTPSIGNTWQEYVSLIGWTY